MNAFEKPYRGKDIAGTRYGRLLVVGLHGFVRRQSRPDQRFAQWKCICDCGNERILLAGQMQSGNTLSCGCLHKEQLADMARKHGHKPLHGQQHPLYWRWQQMIQRCTNPKNRAYKWYGALGIKVCARWRNFVPFLEDMESSFQPGLTIDRRDVNGDYCKDNCQWVTWDKQIANKRKKNVNTIHGTFV